MGIAGCSLMRAPDAAFAASTHTFLPWVGQWEALQRQGRREARGELDEVSDYPRSYGTGKNY